jgi:hypothetical protein
MLFLIVLSQIWCTVLIGIQLVFRKNSGELRNNTIIEFILFDAAKFHLF